MILNWNIEVIVNFLVAAVGLIFTITTYYSPQVKKIKSLFYIRLGFTGFWVFMLLDGFAFLFLSEFLGLINVIILFLATIFIIIGVNYTIKESFYSIGLIIAIGLSILLFYVGTQPGAVDIELQSGYLRVRWVGLFSTLAMTLTGVALYYLFYWGIKTYKHAPFLIKKEASIFFIGILIISPLSLLFYYLYVFEPLFILASSFTMLVGAIIITLIIIREPKLLYILPFTIYRIVVKDRDGHPLYDHDWSESNITETIFTGFLNAVQLMSEEVMHIGGLLDIHLEEGILILKESNRITVGLVSSKSSKLLRGSVIKFTEDFEKKFDHELKRSETEMSHYEGAFELIEKYFSNFPYKIIKSKTEPLLLKGKYLKIPLELENKLRNVFPDDKEYEAIKAELLKAPLYFASDFIKLHDDLKDEMERISGEEVKYLDENYEEN
ncbi:hypothetical protein ES703_17043 [subsurface metagenome]